ncbi:hypothetical protein TNCV_4663891 [Trichonephila clavipes]|uniref:Uncharacterized protein n=1 Tax=Trichonephila clavipes TaxID=2585209 RepID=A0A8X6VE20_TRICX|nr:hypothetical protein TNCV_4663891 [Trichonephila clavipes]
MSVSVSCLIVIPLNFSQRKSSIREGESCNVTSPNIKSGRHLCWIRHPHVHLAAAAHPLFDPRGIEHRRPEDERERCFELTRERWPTVPSLTK